MFVYTLKSIFPYMISEVVSTFTSRLWTSVTCHAKGGSLNFQQLICGYVLTSLLVHQELPKFILCASWGINNRRIEQYGARLSFLDGFQIACKCQCVRELLLSLRKRSQHWRRLPYRADIKVCWRNQGKAKRRKRVLSDCSCYVVDSNEEFLSF